jgi:hypothetical protein
MTTGTPPPEREPASAEGSGSRSARRTLAVAAALAVAATGLAAWPLAGHRLPARVATHWDGSGTADGSSGRTATAVAFTVAVAVLALLVVAAHLVGARRGREAPVGATVGVGVGAFLVALAGGLSAVTVAANIDVADWTDADLPVAAFGAAIAVASGVGWLGARAGVPSGLPSAGAIPSPAGVAPLPAGIRMAWAGGSRSRAMAAGAVVAGVVAAAAVPFAMAAVPALAAVAVAFASMASLRATVGEHGLRVRTGLVPWPSVALPLDRIVRAEAIEVLPSAWGGWGYRGSLRLFRRAAWVLRRGPGVRVDLADGAVFVVTVDDAEGAATTLAALVARRSTTPPHQP